MATAETNLPAKDHAKTPVRSQGASGQPLESIRREFDRLFEELDRAFWLAPFSLIGRAMAKPTNGDSAWMTAPVVDAVERNDAYEITAEMPGMDEKNIEVSLLDDRLKISGEKREDTTDDSTDHYVRERRFGSFERSFALPDDVISDKIQANYANGVLHVTLPKNPEAKSAKRRIEVKGS